MFDRDRWKEIMDTLGRNPIRTILTGLGVFWGIFMLVCMIGSGNGLERGIINNFGGMATNSFFVWSQTTSKPYKGHSAGRSIEYSTKDIEAIQQKVDGLETIAPRNQLGGFRGGHNVVRHGEAGSFSVMADYPAIRQLKDLKMAHGRFINQLDLDSARKVCAIGQRVYEVLFDKGVDPIGERVRINGIAFTVVGQFWSDRSGRRNENDKVFIPFNTFQKAFGEGNTVGWFSFIAKPDADAKEAEEAVVSLLKERHEIHPDDPRAIGHFNVAERFDRMTGLFSAIRILIWIVGGGTLLAGVIGVSNIMLVTVKERTKEIGIRRAIGATPLSIISQILLESLVLTFIAGYLGLVAGVATLEGVNAMISQPGSDPGMFMNPGIDLRVGLTALAIIVIGGLFAGTLPAQRAVSIKPVVAIREE